MTSYVRADQRLLAMALVGYESEKAKIEAAIAEIRKQLGRRGPGRPRAVATEKEQTGTRKWTMSVSASRQIAMGQRKRWAAIKKAEVTPAKPKRKLSVAGRKAIVEALRKRWAVVRKGQTQKSLKPRVRKAA